MPIKKIELKHKETTELEALSFTTKKFNELIEASNRQERAIRFLAEFMVIEGNVNSILEGK